MRIFQNIQFSSSETDRKVMLVVSTIFMSLAWLAVAGGLTFALVQKFRPDADDWNTFEIVVVCVLALMLVIIPFQLARYFREWRAL